MNNRVIVFGGWAASPEILKPVLGNTCQFYDVNEIIPLLYEGKTLKPNWADIVFEIVDLGDKGVSVDLYGWSTGSIIALALSQKTAVRNLILLSSTPSFCRRERYQYGQRPVVLQMMRDELAKPDNKVIEQFAKQSGMAIDLFSKKYSVENLQMVLQFLEDVNLLPLKSTKAHKKLVLHGRQDMIIPCSAGEYCAKGIGARFLVYDGGHGFFVDKGEQIRKDIEES